MHNEGKLFNNGIFFFWYLPILKSEVAGYHLKKIFFLSKDNTITTLKVWIVQKKILPATTPSSPNPAPAVVTRIAFAQSPVQT